MSAKQTIEGIDPKYITNRQGKDHVMYDGLLDLAHRSGLKSIRTQLLQAPCAENGHLAISHAEVTLERGTFTGIGDASPDNVGRMIAVHITRMAETRAKARALRDALNIKGAAVEELGSEGDEDQPQQQNGTQQQHPVIAAREAAKAAAGPPRGPVNTPPVTADTGGMASEQQIARLHKLQAALGRPAMVSSNLTREEAASQIGELVRLFNEQSRTGKPPGPSADAPATQEQYNKLIELGNLLQSKFGYTAPIADSYNQLSAQIAITELKAKGRELAAQQAEPTVAR